MRWPRTPALLHARRLLPSCLLGVALLSRPAGAAEPAARWELIAVGSETSLWLVVGERQADAAEMLQWFACYDSRSQRVVPVAGVPPQVGPIGRAGPAGESIHVFYADGTGAHFRYSRQAARREIPLPGRNVPLALSGEAGVLWALVEAKTAEAVETAWHEALARRAAETRAGEPPAPASHPAVPAPVPGERAEGAYHLVRYDGGQWMPGLAVPSTWAPAKGTWILITPDRQYLLWQAHGDDSELRCAWREQGVWRIGPVARFSAPLVNGAAGATAEGLVFSALVSHTAQTDQLACETWCWPAREDREAEWRKLSDIQDPDGGPPGLPPGSAVAVFGERLAFLRVGAKSGQPEVGLWPVHGGSPERAFESLPRAAAGKRPGSRQGAAEYLVLLALGLLVFLVFWRRQDSIAIPVVLPEGMRLAGYARRALAAAVDMLPAGLIAGGWWHEPLVEYTRDFYDAWQTAMAGTPEALNALERPEPLFWAWLTFRLLYTGYCGVFEWAWSRTPGKRLVGCWVVDDSAARPGIRQIATRNLTRIVELEERLFIWPFLLVIFVTQNRQRIGDLLARTIVIEGPGPIEAAAETDIDSDDE